MKKFSTKQKFIYSIIAFFSLIIVSFSTLTIVRGINFSKIQSANILSIQQQNDLETLLQNAISNTESGAVQVVVSHPENEFLELAGFSNVANAPEKSYLMIKHRRDKQFFLSRIQY